MNKYAAAFALFCTFFAHERAKRPFLLRNGLSVLDYIRNKNSN